MTTEDDATKGDEQAKRLKFRQSMTVGLLVAGYAGYYLCRSNLSATMPAISEDMVARGIRPAKVNDAFWAGPSRSEQSAMPSASSPREV